MEELMKKSLNKGFRKYTYFEFTHLDDENETIKFFKEQGEIILTK